MVRVQMLAEGRATREIVKELGLSFTQLKELRGVFPKYVGVRELEGGLEALRRSTYRYFKGLRRLVAALRPLKTCIDSHTNIQLGENY